MQRHAHDARKRGVRVDQDGVGSRYRQSQSVNEPVTATRRWAQQV